MRGEGGGGHRFPFPAGQGASFLVSLSFTFNLISLWFKLYKSSVWYFWIIFRHKMVWANGWALVPPPPSQMHTINKTLRVFTLCSLLLKLKFKFRNHPQEPPAKWRTHDPDCPVLTFLDLHREPGPGPLCLELCRLQRPWWAGGSSVL